MKKYLTIALAAGLALVSCQKEVLVENSEAPANEITLKAATVSTKSAIDGSTFPDGYGMLVSAYRNKQVGDTEGAGDASADYFEGIKFVKTGSGSTVWGGATSPKYWPLNGTLDFLCIASAGINADDTGIYPTCTWGEGSGTAANVAKKVVATVPDNSGKFDDILYGSANGKSYSAGGTGIEFKHAGCAVVFLARSNVAYDATKNVGITITDITVNDPYTSGTLTVSNPAAGNGTGTLSATWATTGTVATLPARVWDAGNTGVKTDEPTLDETAHRLDLKAVYSDPGAESSTLPSLTSNKFGDAYVIVPAQDAKAFTISYTLHNGKKADGTTNLDLKYTYKYTPASTEKWEVGKKVIYLIDITQYMIEIKPRVTDWEPQFKNVEIN